MFEHHKQPLASPSEFARRMLRYSLVTAGIILLASLGVLAAPIFHRFMHRFHLELEVD